MLAAASRTQDSAEMMRPTPSGESAEVSLGASRMCEAWRKQANPPTAAAEDERIRAELDRLAGELVVEPDEPGQVEGDVADRHRQHGRHRVAVEGALRHPADDEGGEHEADDVSAGRPFNYSPAQGPVG